MQCDVTGERANGRTTEEEMREANTTTANRSSPGRDSPLPLAAGDSPPRPLTNGEYDIMLIDFNNLTPAINIYRKYVRITLFEMYLITPFWL